MADTQTDTSEDKEITTDTPVATPEPTAVATDTSQNTAATTAPVANPAEAAQAAEPAAPMVVADPDAQAPAPTQAPAQDLSTPEKQSDALAQGPTPDNSNDTVGVRSPAQDAVQRHLADIVLAGDFGSGKITPKTYGDLFENKSTLGKIGTLFGLLLSGAGSGLAKQPNAVLEMMNREIDRDVNAQAQNQGNKQSFFKLAMEQEKNLADIEHTQAVAAATRMGTEGQSLKNEIDAYNTKMMPGIQKLNAYARAQNASLLAAVQQQQNLVNNMSEGPAKAQAQQYIDNVMRPAAMQKLAENEHDLAKKKTVLDAAYPNPAKKLIPPSDPRGPAVNQKLLQQKIQIGKVNPKNPMGIPEGAAPSVVAEQNYIQANRAAYADWIDSFNKLAAMKNAGQVPYVSAIKGAITGLGTAIGSVGGPIGAGIGGALAHTLGNSGTSLQSQYERERDVQVEALKNRLGPNLSEDDKNRMITAMLPSWTDDPKNFGEVYRKGAQHFSSLEEGHKGNLELYGLATPFPVMQFQPPKTKKSD